jgi:DsbC/DsbD-like thiol-disulfide interchange protein
MFARFPVTVAVVLALAVTASGTQPPRPRATVTPIVETDGARAGTTVRVALRVGLPAGVHVQSNKPRDPSLIATTLTFELPAGISVEEIVYPEPSDLPQMGQATPLAVFEQNFDVGVGLSLSPALAAGEVRVAARLRYQACDASTCYIPAREMFQWTLRIVPAGTLTPVVNGDVFEHIRFRRP